MQKERRKHNRREINAGVKLYGPEFGALSGRTRNIADGGFFIALENVPAVSPGASLKAVLLDSKNPDLIFNLQVVRLEADGMALKIVDYELNGELHDIQELREHWHAQKTLAK